MRQYMTFADRKKFKADVTDALRVSLERGLRFIAPDDDVEILPPSDPHTINIKINTMRGPEFFEVKTCARQ